ncbi:MAG: maleylpyruvate isomerase family mycothiol-dependent enzyme [Acidimicrobiales bacterium]|nr:maleylpyruvate isomerase family mycothiol-dependent enzyme [Acidimicrobiales bacterium]
MTEPVIDLLDQTWASIADLLTEVSATDWELPTDLPGWTVRDVVSHMIGTERMLLGEDTPEPPPEPGPHVRNAIGEFNEAWVVARRGRSGAEILDEFRDVTARRLEQLRALPAEAWDEVGFTPEGEGPYRRFMEIRVFDCWEHEQDIRRATDRPGHLDGPVAAHSVGEVTSKLGYIVAKRAGAPDGTTVTFDITGSLPMILPVFVDGRARILDREPSDPDATIHLDTEAYNALGCGRWSAQHALDTGRAALSGDVDLARRVLDNMAFTI